MRPIQWLKNGFVVMPLIFSKELFVKSAVLTVFFYALLFSLASSVVYLLNDIVDKEKDRLHPTKKLRPVASGDLSVKRAAIFALLLAGVSLAVSFVQSMQGFLVLLSYLVLNIAYSLYVKNVVVLDVIFIATGFVLRAVGGALVISVLASEWLILCTFLLALFLGFCKRRQELSIMDRGYTAPLVDALIIISAACTIISYAIYTLSPATIEKFSTTKLLLTIPFVIFGVFRYISLVFSSGKEDSPAHLLLGDKTLLFTVILWAVVSGLIIYLQ
jgi:4-hydroxybenzoate polyprenyltransferase